MTDDPPDTATDEPGEPSEPGRPAGPAARLRRLPLWILVLVGAVVGGLVGLGVSAALSDDDGDDGARLSLQDAGGEEAAARQAAKQSFLDAWQRYRNATYSAELVFERVATNGQRLRSDSTFVQQPPRRVVRQADSVQLTAGADSRTCNRVNGAVSCAPAPDLDYASAVEGELATWRTALDGSIPYYVVSAPEPGCFQLDVAVEITDPPYGEVARFCFDDATGALVKRQIVRRTATDTEEAISVSAAIPPDAFTATLPDTPTSTTTPPATNLPGPASTTTR